MQVRSLALLSGLRIWHRHELWCRSQTWLRSHVVVAVAQASSYSSDSTPSLETSIGLQCGPKKKKGEREREREREKWSLSISFMGTSHISATFRLAGSASPLSAFFKLCCFGQVTSYLSLSFLLYEIGLIRVTILQGSWKFQMKAWKHSLNYKQ